MILSPFQCFERAVGAAQLHSARDPHNKLKLSKYSNPTLLPIYLCRDTCNMTNNSRNYTILYGEVGNKTSIFTANAPRKSFYC